MLGLWLVEVLLCAVLFHGLLTGSWLSGLGLADASGGTWLSTNRAAALALTFGLSSAAVGLYSPETYLRTRGLLVNTAVGVVLASPAIWLVGRFCGLDLSGVSYGHPLLAVEAVLGLTVMLFAMRLAFSWAVRADLFVRRVLIIGDDAAAERTRAAIRLERGAIRVHDVLPSDGMAALTPRRLRQERIWAVILAGRACDALAAREVLRATSQGVRLYSDTEFWERQLRRIDVDQTGGSWRPGETGLEDDPGSARALTRAAIRRLADIVLSLVLLAATFPLMLATAAAVALESRGPVLYRQERVGLHGRSFTLLKFRSMRIDAEALGPVWATTRDPRVTRIGAFIRLVRIDELPQLLNVLRGEMSFIGPRPERPHFTGQLQQALPLFRDRLLVKPGLTGWAQVNYPYGASVEDARAKLSYDLYYVKHRGLLLDLLILLATVRVVLFQRGAR